MSEGMVTGYVTKYGAGKKTVSVTCSVSVLVTVVTRTVSLRPLQPRWSRATMTTAIITMANHFQSTFMAIGL